MGNSHPFLVMEYSWNWESIEMDPLFNTRSKRKCLRGKRERQKKG